MVESIRKDLFSICGERGVLFDEPLSGHTSFRIGGPADAFVMPRDEDQLEKVIDYCDRNEIPRILLGNGTNILAADEGYRGTVIQIFKNMAGFEQNGTEIYARAGILLSALSAVCAEQALTGFEFASGIPGTLGGAVTMNAGAYGGEIKDVITGARVFEPGRGIRDLKPEELMLGYRTSVIKHTDMIVLGAGIRLEHGDPEKISAKLAELKEARTSKQPLEYPSAGSTFKRPEGYFAGKLIMDAELAGYTVGGAQVSEKHCGFVINRGGATAADVNALIAHVVKTVEDRFGVTLEREIRSLG